MAVLLKNNASSTLVSSIDTVATSVVVQTGDAAKFPSPVAPDWFPITLVDAGGNMEVMRCTARAGGTLTVVRAQEGTTARAFVAGARVDLRTTAAALAALNPAQAISEATTDETPADGDQFGYRAAAGGGFLKATWAGIKASLKAYFDGIYPQLVHNHDTAYFPISGAAPNTTSILTLAPAAGDALVNLTPAATNANAGLELKAKGTGLAFVDLTGGGFTGDYGWRCAVPTGNDNIQFLYGDADGVGGGAAGSKLNLDKNGNLTVSGALNTGGYITSGAGIVAKDVGGGYGVRIVAHTDTVGRLQFVNNAQSTQVGAIYNSASANGGLVISPHIDQSLTIQGDSPRIRFHEPGVKETYILLDAAELSIRNGDLSQTHKFLSDGNIWSASWNDTVHNRIETRAQAWANTRQHYDVGADGIGSYCMELRANITLNTTATVTGHAGTWKAVAQANLGAGNVVLWQRIG